MRNLLVFIVINLFVASLVVADQNLSYDYARIYFGQEKEYALVNNVWGKKSIIGNADDINYTSEIYTKNENSNPTIGWFSNWPCASKDVVAFPSIIFGANPWCDFSTTKLLPCKLDANNISLTYKAKIKYQANKDMTKEARQQMDKRKSILGKGPVPYNFTIDMWVTNSNKQTPDNVNSEIMIWLVRHEILPDGKVKEKVTIDGKRYALWVNENQLGMGFKYLTFVSEESQTEGTINLSYFIQYLLKKKYISNDLYLTAIETGNEMFAGLEGSTEISDYKITVSPK